LMWTTASLTLDPSCKELSLINASWIEMDTFKSTKKVLAF